MAEYMKSKIPLNLQPMANAYHDRIERQIKNLEEDLKDDEAVVASVLLNNGETIQVTWFGYHNPYMIVVDGEDVKGNSVRALIPMDSIQILLTKVKKKQDQRTRQIGFQTRDTKADEY